VSADGKSAYVAGGNTLSQYNVDPLSGALSPKTPATVASGPGSQAIAVTPDGKNVYASNTGDGTVSQYTIDPVSGALSPKTPTTVAAGSGAAGVAVSPDGRSAYVANGFDNTVSEYNIDPLSGRLLPKNPATVASGRDPSDVAVTPDRRSAYVTNGFDNTVSQYNVDPVSGALSPKTPATVAAGLTPFAVAVTVDGKNAYVTDIGDIFHGVGTVSQYSIDPVSGGLSPKNPATVVTGGAPKGIAVGPLPLARDTTATTVSCSPVTFAPGDPTVCRATVTDAATAGQTTPTGSVSFTSSGPGSFGGSPCTLSGSGAPASCSVFFTSFPRGGRVITASYSGDTTHEKSSDATLVAISVPASTDGCLVFGHGRITASNGDRATFRGLAVALPPRGAELYRDKGPSNLFGLASTSVDAVTCSTDASRASVLGTAKLNAAGSVEYRIDIQLTAWERGKDAYRIRLSHGYDSGAQPIRHGDLDIRLRGSEHQHYDANANHTRGGQQDGG
jgi:hypothetical protein